MAAEAAVAVVDVVDGVDAADAADAAAAAALTSPGLDEVVQDGEEEKEGERRRTWGGDGKDVDAVNVEQVAAPPGRHESVRACCIPIRMLP